MISIIGIPLDENSSYLRGASLAPDKIREALHSASSNSFAENGAAISDGIWKNMGNLRISGMPQAFNEIEKSVAQELAGNNKVLSLGGDHSITYPIIKAYAKKYPDLEILHIDAHPDLYQVFQGNTYSHACPFARIMEEKLASRLVQVGIRTFTEHQREQARRFKVEVVEMKDWQDSMRFNFTGPVYISLDMDALDPAFAPGVSHHEPGGFSTRQVLAIIQNLNAAVVGADIVEFNPSRDIHDMTATVAAKLCKELIVKLNM